MSNIYLIQVTDEHSVLTERFVQGRVEADKLFNSLNPKSGCFVTMNKADKSLNGEFVRGEYIKHKSF